MSPIVSELNYFLGLGALVMQAVTLGLIALYVYEKFSKQTTALGILISRVALPLSFEVAVGAATLTLVYSEVFGFVPCGLCWLQRVFMFPSVFITGIALFARDRVFAPMYITALSVCGAVIALYNHYLQMGGSELVTCPAAGGDCAKRILFEFGYITFPLLAFTLFAFLIVLMLFVRRGNVAERSL